jgi:hypothetical protein
MTGGSGTTAVTPLDAEVVVELVDALYDRWAGGRALPGLRRSNGRAGGGVVCKG